MVELLGEVFSFCNDRIFAAADFQFVAVRVLKKEGVIAGAVPSANFRTFQILAANFAHESRDAVDFGGGVRPERDARPVRLMMSILGEAEKIRGLTFSGR